MPKNKHIAAMSGGGKKKPSVKAGPDAHDRAVAAKVQPLADTYAEYLQSPLYLQRLRGMQVEAPEAVVADRLANLDKLRAFSSALKGEHLSYNNRFQDGAFLGEEPSLAVNKDTPRETVMHELGHTFNQPEVMQRAMGQSPRTATGKSMSPVEAWRFINRAKIPATLKQSAAQYYEGQGAQFGQYHTDSSGAVTPAAMDDHGTSTSEYKSDLDAVRLILNEAGYTKKFGDNLSLDTLKKALADPKVKEKPHLQRMLRNFTPEAIVDLNNTIAARKASLKNNLA